MDNYRFLTKKYEIDTTYTFTLWEIGFHKQ